MRVLLKLSGESLGGSKGQGLDSSSLVSYAAEIAAAVKAGHQIATVIGGGNIFRGLQGMSKGFDRIDGDRMGMLATVINSIALSCALRSEGIKTEVFTATPMLPIAKYYRKEDALSLLEEGAVTLIAGGTGNPFFTTDSGAALRALELSADALFKGTKVDGIYTADPLKDPNAKKYEELSFETALAKDLKVMDAAAFALCREGSIPIVVFNMEQQGNLSKLLAGEKIGTRVHE